jgi:hypothetical protein
VFAAGSHRGLDITEYDNRCHGLPVALVHLAWVLDHRSPNPRRNRPRPRFTVRYALRRTTRLA